MRSLIPCRFPITLLLAAASAFGCAHTASTSDALGHVPPDADIVGDLDLTTPGKGGTDIAWVFGLVAVFAMDDARLYGITVRCGLPVKNVERILIVRAESTWGLVIDEPGVGDRRWMACATKRSPRISGFDGPRRGVSLEQWSIAELASDRVAAGPTEWVKSVVSRSGAAAPGEVVAAPVAALMATARGSRFRIALPYTVEEGVQGELVLSFQSSDAPRSDTILEATLTLGTPAQAASALEKITGVLAELYNIAIIGDMMPRRTLDTLWPKVVTSANQITLRIAVSDQDFAAVSTSAFEQLKAMMRSELDESRKGERGIF